MSAARVRRAADDGFTLVELVVAMGVLTIILLAVGGLMFSTTITQRTVSSVTGASSSAQTAADSLRTQLRNAAEFRRTTVDGHDELLVARIAGRGGSAGYLCHGWYFASDEGELRTASWPVSGSTPLPTSPAGAASWSVLLTGVSVRDGATAVFAEPVGGTIKIGFDVATDARNDPVAIEFTAAMNGHQGGGTTCWD